MYDSILQELLPQAVAIGISYSEFWEMTPNDLQAYQEGTKKRIELEAQIFNHNAWLQGAYFQQAVGSVLAKNVKYPERPLGTEPTKEETKAKLLAYFAQLNADFKARQKAQKG